MYRTHLRKIQERTSVPGKPVQLEVSQDLLSLLVSAFRDLDRLIQRSFERVLEIPPADTVGLTVLNSTIAENVALIKRLSVESANDLQLALLENPSLHRDGLSRLIRERFEVQQSRAEFWAVDQTLKTNSRLSEVRASAAGFSRYRWITSNDERVRHDHARLDRQVFRYDSPPVTDQRTGARNNPGQDYRCRCTAEPLFDDE